MAKQETQQEILRLEALLNLNGQQFKKDFNKVLSEAISEAEQKIGSWRSAVSAHPVSSGYKKYSFSGPWQATEQGYEFMGQQLVGKSGRPIRPDSRQARQLANKLYRDYLSDLREKASTSLMEVKGLQSESNSGRFKAGLGSLEEKMKLGSKIGFNTTQYNRSLYEMGKNLGYSTEQLEEFYKKAEPIWVKIGKRALETVPIWMLIRSGILGIQNAFSETLKFWSEFESVMAEIKIVGQGTAEEYDNLGKSILNFATIYGTSIKEVAGAAKIFAQQGLSIREVTEMTKASTLGALVLGENVTTVAENLTSAVRAYNIPMEDSVLIIDKWMKVQKDFAISAKELADGMKTSGAAAAAFGISFDKFAGHLTAIVETTRKSGSEAANALQMIYTRLFSTAKNSIQEIAKVPIYQNASGKAVMETTHIFRQSSDVLDDLAISWKTLNESEKINLATQVGSRRQATPFIALMENYDRALKAEIESLSAAGTSMEAFAIIQDTVNFKTKQMSNSWLTLANSVQQTDIWKGAIDSVKGLADAFLYLVNARDAYIKKLNQEKQLEVDSLTLRKNKIETLRQLWDIEKRQENNPNKEYYNKIKEARISLEKLYPDINKENIQKEIDNLNRKIVTTDVKNSFSKERMNLELYGYYDRTVKGQLSREQREFLARKYNFTSGNVDKEIVNASAEMSKKYGSFDKALKEYETTVNKEIETRLDKILIDEESRVDWETKIENLTEKNLATVKEIESSLNHQVQMMGLKGKTEAEILSYQIKQYETNNKLKNSEDARTKLTELRYKYEEAITKEIYQQSDKIESSLAGSFKNILSGTGTTRGIFTDLNSTMVESYRSTVSDSLARNVMSSGVGEMFGKSMLSLRGGIEEAHKTVYKWIIKGHQDGMSGKVDPSIGGVSSGFSGRVGKFSLPGFGVGGMFYTSEFGGYKNATEQAAGARMGYPSSASQNRNKMLMGGVNAAITGYSAYQSGQAGGLTTAGSVMSGIGGAMMSNPYTAIPGLIMTVAANLWMKNKKGQTSTEWKTTEGLVSSKIDVTNKSLEIINRNLIGLRTDMRTFMLPDSSYWSEKNSLDAEFSLSSRRGSY